MKLDAGGAVPVCPQAREKSRPYAHTEKSPAFQDQRSVKSGGLFLVKFVPSKGHAAGPSREGGRKGYSSEGGSGSVGRCFRKARSIQMDQNRVVRQGVTSMGSRKSRLTRPTAAVKTTINTVKGR